MKVFTDPQRDAEFASRGFAGLSLLKAEDVAEAVAAIGGLRPADEFRGGRFRSYHCTFLDTDRTYRREVQSLIEAIFTPHVEKHLADYKIVTSNLYVKPPGEGRFVPHQNWPGTANPNEAAVSLWCPLVDVDEKNGALHFIPGSHKLLPHVQGLKGLPYVHRIWTELEDLLEPYPMKAGEAVVFDESLIHASPINRSSEPRVAIQILCVPAASTPVYFYPDSSDRFELIRAEPEFWVENDPEMLLSRQAEWESLGFIRSSNRFVSLDEFKALLADGDNIRRRGLRYASVE